MSVTFTACLFLGIKLDCVDEDLVEKLDTANIENLEIIFDCYSTDYMYIGKLISDVRDYDDHKEVNNLLSVVNDENLREDISDKLKSICNIHDFKIDLHFFTHYI